MIGDVQFYCKDVVRPECLWVGRSGWERVCMVPRWRACRGVVGVVASQRPHGGVVAVSVTVRESHEVVGGATSARWQGGRLAEVVPRRCRVGGCGSVAADVDGGYESAHWTAR